jgi:hypothetical protein
MADGQTGEGRLEVGDDLLDEDGALEVVDASPLCVALTVRPRLTIR